MAKRSTGAWEVYESMRLNLKDLQRDGFFRDGCTGTGPVSWNKNGEPSGTIGVACTYRKGGDSYIKLSYSVTDSEGNKRDHHYKVRIIEVPSNLGKGSVLYFECPETKKLCRILYMAYGSQRFKCRQAYEKRGQRLYYDCQIESQIWRYNANYWRIESHLEKMGRIRMQYAGKITRTHARRERLWKKQIRMDHERWCGRGVPKSLIGKLGNFL